MGNRLLGNWKKKTSTRNGSRKLRRPASLTLETLEERQLLTVSTFQNGDGSGYVGQEDTVLYSREPDVNFGTEGSISPDQQDSNGARQGLLKFDDIVGPGFEIPLGAKIAASGTTSGGGASLIVDVVNDSNSAMQMSLYRMQVPWSESSATWNTFGQIGGVQASEGESSDLPPDGILFDPDTSANSATAGIFDVTRSLEYWAAGAINEGWMIESAATNGWDFRTKESAPAQRPLLEVDWSVPTDDEFQILTTEFFAAEGNSGNTTATVEIARMGDLAGSVDLDWAVAAGTGAQAGVDFVAASGTVNFASGQAFATVDVEIIGDTLLEGNETILFTITDNTGANGVIAGRETATITIADDDALINEVLANISSGTQNEENREYIELIGTPNASLDDYFFVVFEGEEEEGGDTMGLEVGVADFVFDLSGQSFGSNGLLVIAPTNWDYQALADAGTNIINTAALDGTGGVLEDESQTYALIRSPSTSLIQDFDYDQVGTYENATNQAIGTGVAILDQLPADADFVDSVGVVEGGGDDRDRTLTTEQINHPGIHVHQPTGAPGGSGRVTSDAVSRRAGQTLPNSIGAWFNGDIADGDANGSLAYENDTFFISVVAPDGAVLTPGAPNDLRTVFFSVADQNIEVDESAGMVDITVERTGPLGESVTFDYETVDVGSATAGADFTPVMAQASFPANMATTTISVPILSDSVAEGFEFFRVDITSATDGYLITNGQSTQSGAINGEAVVTIADGDVLIKSFKDGVSGYDGTVDAYIDGGSVLDKFGQDPVIRVDAVKGEGEDPIVDFRPQQGLLRFDDMFGASADQIPEGSKIFSAFLTVNVQNVSSGADIRFFPMMQDWEQVNTTWRDPQGNLGGAILNGVTPDDVEAGAVPDAVVPEPGRAGLVQIPLNADTIQAWANDSLDNFGWSIVSDSSSLWAFNSSEAFAIGTEKPELTILYTEPDSASAGEFGFSVDDYTVNESGSAQITVNRIGGSLGAATVNWDASAGTGSLADLAGSTNGTLSFAAGELSKTFNLNINNDSDIEMNETINLALSNPSAGTLARDMSTLTIRDNDYNVSSGDLLLNEIFINSPGNDPPSEFVELKGVPGLGFGSLYYVALEGLIGDRTGSAEKVVDLGGFSNGAVNADDGNGYTVITPQEPGWTYNNVAGATQIDTLGTIATENISTQNDSTTYAILYSPDSRMTLSEFDYDWNDDGVLELPAGVQFVDSVGVRVLGAMDQLYGPGTNEASFGVNDNDVDAVSRQRNNNSRNQGSAWFGGDLLPAGDDYLLYEPGESFALPLTGTSMSPGEPNTGNASESPLVSMTGVVDNGNGTFTATFNGPVSQVMDGAGDSSPTLGAGITITDDLGNVVTNVDQIVTVAGKGTNSLTISFTGPGVVGGMLPAGDYLLNFTGNGMVGNARAVDVANDGSEIDGSFQFAFTATGGGVNGDFNGDMLWNCDDIDALVAEIAAGTNNPSFDMTNDGMVNLADRDAWLAAAGAINLPSGNPYLLGDADLNGAVDGADFIAWEQ